MNKRFRFLPVLALAILTTGFLALRGGEASTPGGSPAHAGGTSPAWEVSGVFAEACECTAPCPCWSGKMPTQHHCHNVQVYKILKGHDGAVSLDGQVVVAAVVSAEGKIMDENAGHSVLAAIYTDRSASPAQRKAIQEIWRNSMLKEIRGDKGGVKSVAYETADVSSDHAVVMIPGILSFEVRKGSGEPIQEKDPYIQNLRVGRSVRYRYSDYGMTWNEPGRHAAFARFHAQSDRVSAQ